MKIKIIIICVCLVVFYSCTKENNVEPNLNGALFVDSTPQGAKIYLLGTNTNKVTPCKFENLASGQYKVTLKLQPLNDTTFYTNVQNNLLTTEHIKMVLPLDVSISESINDTLIDLGRGRTITKVLVFHFTFNQNILLTKIIITAPWGLSSSIPYNGLKVFTNEIIDTNLLIEYDPGIWKFLIKGIKTQYDSTYFEYYAEYIIN